MLRFQVLIMRSFFETLASLVCFRNLIC